MKKLLLLCCFAGLMAAFALAALNDTPDIRQNLPLTPRQEILDLQAQISAAKAAGQTPDPAWSAKIDQLRAQFDIFQDAAKAPAVPSESNDPLWSQPAAPDTRTPEEIQHDLTTANPSATDGSRGNPVLSPLEQQIRDLEDYWNLAGATPLPYEVPVDMPLDLKGQLNDLYAQRPENHQARNPLDQGNDNCPAAVITTLPFTEYGSTAGLANNFTTCGPNTAPDVIYQWTASVSGFVMFSLCGSYYDTRLEIRSGGACPGSNQLGCNDDSGPACTGLQSSIRLNVTSGTVYFIIVDGFSSASGIYRLSMWQDCQSCASGDVIECSGESTDSSHAYLDCDGGCNNITYGGTAHFGSIDCGQTVCGIGFTYAGPTGGNFRDTDFYTFTLAETSTVSVSATAEFPLRLFLFPAGCPIQPQIATGTAAACTELTISSPGCLNPGTYYMWVGPNVTTGIETPLQYRATLTCTSCHVPCLTCQSGDLIECAETPGDTNLVRADCDGGCNNETNGGTATFGSISCGQTVCGQAFTYVSGSGVNFRDTDGYSFSLAEACTVRVRAYADFPVTLFILQGTCPYSTIATISGPACTPIALTTSSCLAPGNYVMWVGPSVFTGFPNPRPYRALLECIPCNGCQIDATINAPGSFAGNTCGEGNDCSLRPSVEQTIRVNIPQAGDWTFMLCGTSPNWDSDIYLTSACCNSGSIITSNDDGCGGVGLSIIRCQTLAAGSYYLTVEGFSASYCGPYNLRVFRCEGRCCYGFPDATCEMTSSAVCADLEGDFFAGETCVSEPCPVRPACLSNSLIGQRPHTRLEGANGFPSDINTSYRVADNFSGLSEPIGTIRFWGFTADLDAGSVPCNEDPMAFQIIFRNASGGFPGAPVNTYNLTLTATNGDTYFGAHVLRQYTTILNPPCNLASGWLEIMGGGDPACDFYWATSPLGDGSAARSLDAGNTWVAYSGDFAFCLGPVCQRADSVVLRDSTATLLKISLWVPTAGTYNFYSTTSTNSVYPAGFVILGSLDLPAGRTNNIQWNIGAATYQRLVVVQQCSATLEAPNDQPREIQTLDPGVLILPGASDAKQ